MLLMRLLLLHNTNTHTHFYAYRSSQHMTLRIKNIQLYTQNLFLLYTQNECKMLNIFFSELHSVHWRANTNKLKCVIVTGAGMGVRGSRPPLLFGWGGVA